MSQAETIEQILSRRPRAHQLGSDVAITTECMFPSNGYVTVYVSGGENECVVSDNGDTLRVVQSHGIEVKNLARWLNPFCKRSGLHHEHGRLETPKIPVSRLASAVPLLANTAAMAARHAVENFSAENKDDILDKIHQSLKEFYGKERVARDVAFAGESLRKYEFDFLVQTDANQRIISDFVKPVTGSINAKVAAHLDVGRLDDSNLTQALIYDAQREWSASDLTFLRSTAHLMPLRQIDRGFTALTVH